MKNPQLFTVRCSPSTSLRLLAASCLVALCAAANAAAPQLARFRPGERVAFLGDSITHGGKYLAFLQMRLAETYGENPPTVINCGVSGDTAAGVTGAGRIAWDVLPHKPDRVFVMLGMNDVVRERWKTVQPASADEAAGRERAVAGYESSLRNVVKELVARVGTVVLITPSPYDQYGTFDDKALLACNEPGLARCAEAVRKIGRELNLPVVDFHAPMTDLLRRNAYQRLCGNDRVHPGDEGHSLMAALVLCACGESDEPFEDLARSMRTDPVAPAALRYATAESAVRRLAEYRKVIRSMGGETNDVKKCDALLDQWIEKNRGIWHETCKNAAANFRSLRSRAGAIEADAQAARAALIEAAQAQAADPARHVDPFVGCSYNGHCFAAACVPFGLVQAGPDTGYLWWDYCSGYRYADTNILGFSQTHLSGTGCGDLGDVLIMPFTGAADLTRTNYASAYRKETQTAQPGFYEVTLDDNCAKVAVAAAKHSAIYEIDYLGAETPRLFVDLQYGILNWSVKDPAERVVACDVRKTDDHTVSGTVETRMWVRRTYAFTLVFDRKITDWQDLPKRDAKEKGRRFALGFDLPAGGRLHAKVALSAKDEAAAARNLVAEIPDWNLGRVRASARADWNALLSRMKAEGDAAQLKTFYTSLYHLFIQPNDIADAGERPFYSTMSFWDTFRAAHPLYTIVAPEKVDGFVDSILRQYDRQGYMPIWTLWGKDNHCMIGNHSIPVVVDAYLKGFRGFDAARAYAAIRKSLTEDAPGRPFNQTATWAKYGYFPFDVVQHESVSKTLEHAYDEWCAARFAEALGKREDAAFFDRRAGNWTNVFDRAVGFARGRDSKGTWREPFSPFKLNVGGNGTGPKDFTEGNSWQYTWHVMQDPQGLMAAMGGREKFLEKLNGLFSQPEQVEGMGFALDATGLVGQYAHGNEPSHHTAYFFQLAGRGDRTAEIVREVCDKFYRPEPDGLCGNDDCGQMSAWYLFSAMGFYPFNPCGGEYVIGAPQLPKITLRIPSANSQLPTANSFTVVAKGLSAENKYVKSVTLNGKPVTDGKIRHADIVKGGELVFEMGK